MDQVALDQLAARASAGGFSSIAEYAEALEAALNEIRLVAGRAWIALDSEVLGDIITMVEVALLPERIKP